MKKVLLTLALVGSLAALAINYFGTPRQMTSPGDSQWQPVTVNLAAHTSPIIPANDRFFALHGDTHNADELSIAASPDLELNWTAESDMFIAEGPTEDINGNLYFSPIYPIENVILVSLDAKTGARRWAVPARDERQSAGGGAPLILNDPDSPGEQIIYLGVYDRAVAIRQSGEMVWDVATGLKPAAANSGGLDDRHVFGLNYHVQADALVGLTAAGDIYVLDRATGDPLLDQPYAIEGAPGVSDTGGPDPGLSARVDSLLADTFGQLDSNQGRFSSILQALFGGGFKVSNYFAIDKNTGRIFIAATAPDGMDGELDGRSGHGSLYAYDLLATNNGRYELVVAGRQDFTGGTGASPALSADGTRVYTADNDQHVLAFDRDLNPLWSIALPENIPASISVSSENNELYAISLKNIYKLVDRGDKAELVWASQLDAFPEIGPYRNFNMTTATIVANGIAVAVGAGLTDGDFTLPIKFGVGLLDRQTGKLISYNATREESVSVTTVSGDGGYYLANSPVRRAVTRTLFGPLVRPLTGGISRYKPINLARLVSAASCASQQRLLAAQATDDPAQKAAFMKHARILESQASLHSNPELTIAQDCQ
jgi:hypothetical protein